MHPRDIPVAGLIALAIVFNPLPGAPIALGAGAIYGHTLGTVYVVAGAELGAILAFMIARWAGYLRQSKKGFNNWAV